MIDENGDGFLTKEEIKSGLMKCGEPMSDETVDDMLRAADKNNDGKVSYQGMKYENTLCVPLFSRLFRIMFTNGRLSNFQRTFNFV